MSMRSKIFYVSSDGTVVVRRSDDYIPKMIELSGGRYVFDDLTGDDSNTSAVKLTMEEFYAQAADADYLIYNSSIDNPINSVKDLEEKDALISKQSKKEMYGVPVNICIRQPISSGN